MARVILVRHCESEANRAGPEGGGSDSPLSARGRAQAEPVRCSFEALAPRMARGAALVASHLRRATDTAAAIGAALGLEVEREPRLGAGETHRERYDLDDPATLLVVGADVLAALAQRIDAGADPLIIVSHRYAIWALLSVLYGERGTAIMDELDNLGNGDRLELELLAGASPAEPIHTPLALACR